MKTLLRRIFGLVIILRALLPIILVVAAIFIVGQIMKEMRLAIQEPVDTIRLNYDRMEAKVDSAVDDFNQVGAQISAVSGSIHQVAQQVGAIPVNVNLDLAPVPVPDGFETKRIKILDVSFDLPTGIKTRNFSLDKNIPIPGLQQVKNFFGNTFGFFSDVNTIVTDVVDLVSITREMGGIGKAVKEMIDGIGGVLGKWGRIILILLILVILLQIAAYLESLNRNLSRGWAMLAGKPGPGEVR